MRVRCGAAAAGLAGGSRLAVLMALTTTGGSGTASVTTIVASVIVSSPVSKDKRIVLVFDNRRRLDRLSRIETRRVSKWDGCAIDTAANDKSLCPRSPRAI